MIHSLDPVVQARFWTLASGLAVMAADRAYVEGSDPLPEGESICLSDGALKLWLSRPDDAPSTRGRVHLDLAGERSFVQELLDAGASFVREEERHVVLEDPEGNAFCVEFVAD